MTRIATALLALCAVASARMAYQLPVGSDLILEGRTLTGSFSCDGRPYGYYADVEYDCRLYHICLPVVDGAGDLVEMAQFTFLCGNQTIFSQDFLGCATIEEAYPCDRAEDLFDSANSEFGVIPEPVK